MSQLHPPTNVAQLLRQSLAAHDRAKLLRRENGDWRPVLEQARDLRVAAHEADPEHTDPAWQAEESRTNTSGTTHDQLMAFYRQMLG